MSMLRLNAWILCEKMEAQLMEMAVINAKVVDKTLALENKLKRLRREKKSLERRMKRMREVGEEWEEVDD